MPLQSAPPDTSGYMIAGYVVFAVIMVIYLASFMIRHRNLEQDLKTLEVIQAEKPARAPAQLSIVKAAAKPKPSRAKSGRAKPTRKRITRKK